MGFDRVLKKPLSPDGREVGEGVMANPLILSRPTPAIPHREGEGFFNGLLNDFSVDWVLSKLAWLND